MTSEIDYIIQDLFDEGLASYSAEEMLTLAGHGLLQQKQELEPSSALIDGYTYRSGDEDQLIAHEKLGQAAGQNLLLKWLPKLRGIAVNKTDESLNEAFSLAAFKRLSENAVSLFLQKAGDTLLPLVGYSDEVAVLTSASLLKKGLSSILKVDGISIIEAEGYVEFDLKVLRGSILAFSPDGEISAPLEFDEKRLHKFLEYTRSSLRNPLGWKAQGDFLWRILFPNEIQYHFERCLGNAKANNRGIRVRLTIDDPSLSLVPWELARYRATGDFLAISNEIIITRYLHNRHRSAKPREQRLKKIAVLASNPKMPSSSLNLEKEARQLQGICHELGINAHLIQPPTNDNLRQELEKINIDALHFMGHGVIKNRTGYIILENKHQKPERYSADRLAMLLEEQKKLKFVLLNSCEGAKSDNHHSFVGLAPRLMQKGIPTVIAMQYPIADKSAILFSRQFYRFLAKGFPITYAVQKGRQLLFNDVGDADLDFITPVIFTTY